VFRIMRKSRVETNERVDTHYTRIY
jgi:hypothetical protein